MSKKPIIVFEGIEGSGKSHHISRVSKYLKEKKISHIKIREPGGNANSEKIRKLILNNKSDFNKNTDLLLYMAARSENIDLIKSSYKKKVILVRARSGARRLVHIPRARLDDVRGACRAAGKRQPQRRATHRSAVDSCGAASLSPHLLLVSSYRRHPSPTRAKPSGWEERARPLLLVSYRPLALCARPGPS